MSNEWTGEGTEVRGWRLRTALEQLDANVLPPGDVVPSHHLPRCARTVAAREQCAESAELSTPVGDDEPPELVEAGAPSTLASSVRFFHAAPLIRNRLEREASCLASLPRQGVTNT